MFEKYREFESVQTQFRKRAGSKKVFLELLYEGSEYSLYRRYIPVAKLSTVVIPLPNYHIGWAIWAEGRIEPALFVYQKDDKAYQITKGIENLFETRKEKRLDYKLDESTLKTLLGEKYKQMRKAVNKTNLSINYEKGLIEGMKYLNGSAFQYNRKETPKKLRN